MAPLQVRSLKKKFYQTTIIQFIALLVVIYFAYSIFNNKSYLVQKYCCMAFAVFICYSIIFEWIHFLRKTPEIEITADSIKILGKLSRVNITWNNVKSCRIESIYGVEYLVVDTLKSRKKVMLMNFDKPSKEIESAITKFSSIS